MKITKNWLLVAVVTPALAFVGTRVLADDAVNIQSYTPNAVATFNGAGDDIYSNGNDHDAIVDQILSRPGTFGGNTYSYWIMNIGDASGSLVGDFSSSSLASLGWTPAVGQNIAVSATWNPYDSLPEIVSASAVTVSSSGNATWNAPNTLGGSWQTTIPLALANNGAGTYGPLSQNLVGYLVDIDNLTISGAGSLTTFPQTNLTLQLTDTGGHKLTMYFDPASYSCDGQMVGAPIPDNSPLAGQSLCDVWGFLTSIPSVNGSVTNWQDQLIPTAFEGIPEPSSFMLAGMGLLSLFAVMRRRHS
jgi:hypothetical protein